MDWLLVALVAVPAFATLIVVALGVAVRRAPGLDYEAEAEAAAAVATLRRIERSPEDPGAGPVQA